MRELGGEYRKVLAGLTPGQDGALRADLAMAWLLGIGLMRTVTAREPLASADPERVCRLVMTTLDRFWTLPAQPPPPDADHGPEGQAPPR
ncbi:MULTISPECIES: hypothetical protein [Streptomyces]|uniref:TetR/AcrR family transcriptional regulator n=1 Tax=Streptomyces TaxID=1883 RepID=UPI001E5D58FA|nr:hypothetical protein [Streptomyces flavotricini]